jgi:hypothetical protein
MSSSPLSTTITQNCPTPQSSVERLLKPHHRHHRELSVDDLEDSLIQPTDNNFPVFWKGNEFREIETIWEFYALFQTLLNEVFKREGCWDGIVSKKSRREKSKEHQEGEGNCMKKNEKTEKDEENGNENGNSQNAETISFSCTDLIDKKTERALLERFIPMITMKDWVFQGVDFSHVSCL